MSNKIRKLINLISKAVKALEIPKHSSKFSKRIFNNRILLILLVLKQHEKKTFRDFIDWLEFSQINEILFLKRIPHFTTLQKFSARAESSWLSFLIKKLAVNCRLAGIDSTGFSLASASDYFKSVIGRKVRNYVKFSIIADMKQQLIAAVKIRKKRRHDSIDFALLVSKAKPKIILADRGYDSERNHIIAEKFGARLISPPRNINVPVCRTSGAHRKFLKRKFPMEIYFQRNKVETIFSVLKRKFGSAVSSRKFSTQKIELLSRAAAYNASRIVSFFVIWLGFLQSLYFSKLYILDTTRFL